MCGVPYAPRIAVAANNDDTRALAQAAHKLKGSAMAIGAMALARVCASLEPSPAGKNELVIQLRSEFRAVKKELLAELGRNEHAGDEPGAA
jgi:HPt (histidine-containing phosphotransfer) domain-containing protein